jgi:hypothetical protein
MRQQRLAPVRPQLSVTCPEDNMLPSGVGERVDLAGGFLCPCVCVYPDPTEVMSKAWFQ